MFPSLLAVSISPFASTFFPRLAASGLQQLSNLMSPISTPQRGGSPLLSAPYTSSPLMRGSGQQSLPPRHATWTSQVCFLHAFCCSLALQAFKRFLICRKSVAGNSTITAILIQLSSWPFGCSNISVTC